jgi:prepilin-type N-terminal cleavage/methylation domain-containing protein
MRGRIKKNHISLIRIIRGGSGFTLIELLYAIIILIILILIAYPLYNSYIDKARLTVAISTLNSVQKDLESYHMDNNKYPASINFSNCTDDLGHSVFPSDFCDQINRDLYPGESYSINDQSYILKARARDNKHTLFTLTASNITKEGI